MRTGVRLAVDPGQVRIGVAVCDAAATVVLPVDAVRRGAGDVDAITAMAREREAVEIVVGWPLSLNGQEGPAARSAAAFAARLAEAAAPTPVRLVDERWTTAVAHRDLRDAGLDARRSRSAIDAQAAARLLEDALREERSTGRPPGEVVPPEDAS